MNAQNQFAGWSYDAAGNLLNDGVHNYQFDAEGRIKCMDAGANCASPAASYVYSVEGRRVKRTASGTTTWYAHDGGSALSEFSNPAQGSGTWQKDYIYLNGALLATESATEGTRFHFSDHLGTPRVVTDAAGSVISRHDYYPYGMELTPWSDGETHKFTAKERDAESGLDNFGARYYSSSVGRFMSTDPSSVSIDKTNAQSWNRYNYTLNNPLRYVDRNGKWPTDIHNRIIDQAFPRLSVQQRDQLKRTSAWVDRVGNQTKAHNHEHAMKSPGENPAAANRAIDQNIQNHEQAAQRAQGGTPANANQIAGGALNEFGQALHTVTDRTSPAHTDANGNPRDWNGVPNPLSPSEVRAANQHNNEEANITPDQMNTAVNSARDAFKRTFGDKAAQDASNPPPPKKEEPKKEGS